MDRIDRESRMDPGEPARGFVAEQVIIPLASKSNIDVTRSAACLPAPVSSIVETHVAAVCRFSIMPLTFFVITRRRCAMTLRLIIEPTSGAQRYAFWIATPPIDDRRTNRDQLQNRFLATSEGTSNSNALAALDTMNMGWPECLYLTRILSRKSWYLKPLNKKFLKGNHRFTNSGIEKDRTETNTWPTYIKS